MKLNLILTLIISFIFFITFDHGKECDKYTP